MSDITSSTSPTRKELANLYQNQPIDTFPQLQKIQQSNTNFMSNGTDWSKNSTEQITKGGYLDSNNNKKKGFGKDKSLYDVQ